MAALYPSESLHGQKIFLFVGDLVGPCRQEMPRWNAVRTDFKAIRIS